MREPRSSQDAKCRPEQRKYMRRSVALLGRSDHTRTAVEEHEHPPPQSKPTALLKAALIDHTGRGDYGHELDEIFIARNDVELVAVADACQTGRQMAREKLSPPKLYADYREMLDKEHPDLVCIATRHADQHHEMAMAAIAAKAHVLLEKPFVRAPFEADEIITAAAEKGLKIAVAHQMRLAPNVRHLLDLVHGGMIGDLLEIRAWGKQDKRSGGEDMMVLGVHQFDLMRMFAGDPLWCSARVMQEGRDIIASDAHVPDVNVGAVAGDEIVAQFAFPNGVQATWTSRRRLREQTGNWAVELQGSAGAVRINCNVPPQIFVAHRNAWRAEGRHERWEVLINDPMGNRNLSGYGFSTENTRVVDDWINAIRSGDEPTCSAVNAAWSIEMVMAVYHAALSAKRVPFPLRDRFHPLKLESAVGSTRKGQSGW